MTIDSTHCSRRDSRGEHRAAGPLGRAALGCGTRLRVRHHETKPFMGRHVGEEREFTIGDTRTLFRVAGVE